MNDYKNLTDDEVVRIYEDIFDTDGNDLPKITHSHIIGNELETET
jgi:hypothetical protein